MSIFYDNTQFHVQPRLTVTIHRRIVIFWQCYTPLPTAKSSYTARHNVVWNDNALKWIRKNIIGSCFFFGQLLYVNITLLTIVDISCVLPLIICRKPFINLKSNVHGKLTLVSKFRQKITNLLFNFWLWIIFIVINGAYLLWGASQQKNPCFISLNKFPSSPPNNLSEEDRFIVEN